MENLGYLLAAYGVIWAVVFGYVLYMQRKQRKLNKQVGQLRELLDKSKTDSG
jgi:CcmD family protein